MFWGSNKKKSEEKNNKWSSGNRVALAKNCRLEGRMSFSSDVIIDGIVKGEIFSSATITLGTDSKVNGTIECNNLFVYGKVDADVAAQKITILSGGKVTGNVNCGSISFGDGANFNGLCKVSQAEQISGSNQAAAIAA